MTLMHNTVIGICAVLFLLALALPDEWLDPQDKVDAYLTDRQARADCRARGLGLAYSISERAARLAAERK